MKNSVVYFLFLFSCLTTAAQNSGANIKFESDYFNFQKVKEGELLVHYFHFVNAGDKPLLITDYKVNCVCTKLLFPLKPIAPGARDSVKLIFDTTSKLGYHLRDISVKSNAINSPYKLRFKVFVRKND